MKTCPRCGERYSENWDACPHCSGAQEPGGSGSYSSSGQYTMKNKTRQTRPVRDGEDIGRAVEGFVDDIFEGITSHLGDVEGQLDDLGNEISGYVERGVRKGRERMDAYRTQREQDRQFSRGQRPDSSYYRNQNRQSRGRQPDYGNYPQRNGERLLPFYEQAWFIVLGFIFFFPAGIACLLLRIYRTEKFNQWLAANQYNLNNDYSSAYDYEPNRGLDSGMDSNGTDAAGEESGASGAGAARQTGSTSGEYYAAGSRNRSSSGASGGSYDGSYRNDFQRSGSVPPASYSRGALKMKRGTRIRSTVLTAVGVLFAATTVSEFVDGNSTAFVGLGITLVTLGFGLYPFLKQRRINKMVAMFDSLIDNRGNTRLSFIAQQLGMPVNKVRIQLQKMINQGFLSEPQNQISAYINGRYDMLVVTHRGKPLVPIEETMEKEGIRIDPMEQQRTRRSAFNEEPEMESVLSPEEELITIINQKIGGAEEDAKERMERIRTSMQNIVLLLEEQPDSYDWNNVKKMRSTYIPGTLDMIEKYSRPSTSPDLRHQIVGMLDTLAKAYENIEDQIRSKHEFDFEIDMEVMRKTLERDGVLGSDFVF